MKAEEHFPLFIAAVIVAAGGLALGPGEGRAFTTNQEASIVMGQPDMTHNSPNQGTDWIDPPLPTAATLRWPGQVQVFAGKVIIADYQNSRVLIYGSIPTEDNASASIVVGQPTMYQNYRNQHPPGEPPWIPGANTLHWPDGAFASGDGKFLVSDSFNNRTLVFNSFPAFNNLSASVVIGQPQLSVWYYANQLGDPAANTHYESRQVTVTSGGKILIADRMNHRVLVFNSIPDSNDADASVVVGQPNMWSNETNQGFGFPSANSLNEPSGVFVDSGGKLYITDTGNNRVLIFSSVPSSDNASAAFVVGQSVFSSGEPNRGLGFCRADTLDEPFGSTYSDGTRLFIPDSGNHRLLIYSSLPTFNGQSASVVLGQPSMTANYVNQVDPEPDPYNPPAPTSRTLYWPNGAFLYGSQLFITDTNNNRVLIYQDSTTPTPSPTPSPSVTPTRSPSPTPTRTPTPSPSPTPSRSPTPTPTPSRSPTPTPTTTPSRTPTPVPTASPSPTASPTITPSPTPSPSRTPSPTPSPSTTPSRTPTPSPSPTATASPSPSATPSVTPTPIGYKTPTPTQTPTPNPSVTPTASPSVTPTMTPEGFKTPTPSPTPSRSPTSTPTPTPSPTSSPSPTVSPSPSPSPTPSPSPLATPSTTPSPSPTITPSPSPSCTPPTPTPQPSPSPSATPSPSPTPTPTSTLSPTPSITATPTAPPALPAAPLYLTLASSDYDGDGSSDVGIFRPSDSLWSVRNVTRFYFGLNQDKPVSGDYDGNGTAEAGIFRAFSGLWSIRGTSAFYLGAVNDRAGPGDFDGDGCCDAAIFRPSQGLWALRNVSRIYFGQSTDYVLAADFRGDGTAGVGIFRSANGYWAIRDLTSFYLGAWGDKPAVADLTGNGAADLGIFRPSTILWSIRNVTRMYFGAAADEIVPADYDGDGTGEPAIFRASSGLWQATGVTRLFFGGVGNVPVTR